MKHLIYTLSLLTLTSVMTEAQEKIGKNFAAGKTFPLKSEIQLHGLNTSLIKPSENETPLFTKTGAKKNKAVAHDKPEENELPANTFRFFAGLGNNNLIADIVTLTDKSFIGELSWQMRAGVRIYDNYELNFGVYGRKFPDAKSEPGLSYNKFLGYSAALVYEFKLPDHTRLGVPFGFELLKYNRNIEFQDAEGKMNFDHYKAFAYGPKIGLRYHFTNQFFIETEMQVQVEKFVSTIDWQEESTVKANKISSFKFFGVSVNRCF